MLRVPCIRCAYLAYPVYHAWYVTYVRNVQYVHSEHHVHCAARDEYDMRYAAYPELHSPRLLRLEVCARMRTHAHARAYERAHRRRIQSSAAPCACAYARVRNHAHPSETRRMRVLGILRIAEEMSVTRMKRKIRSVRVGVCTGHVRRLELRRLRCAW